MSAANAVSSEEDLYPLLDMHGQHVKYINREEMMRLRQDAHAVSYGTKKRTLGCKLIVPLSVIAGYEYYGRALVPSNFAGTRFIFRLKLATDNVNTFLYRFKRLKVTESPEHALLRMLTPVALESSVYTPRERASDAERKQDPGVVRRQDVASMFKAPPEQVERPRQRVVDEIAWQSLGTIVHGLISSKKAVVEMPMRKPQSLVIAKADLPVAA